VLVEEKNELLRKLGRKELVLQLTEPLAELPKALTDRGLTLNSGGTQLKFVYDANAGRTGITNLLSAIRETGIAFRDLETRQSSLEEIFVGLVGSAK